MHLFPESDADAAVPQTSPGKSPFLGWKDRAFPPSASDMKTKTHPAVFAFALLAGLFCKPKASADLPTLDEQPWIGYYAVFTNKRFNFSVTPQGKIELAPMNKKGSPVGKRLSINIDAGIEETLPDGKVVMKQIQAASLKSEQAATENLEKSSIRGQTTGGAEFELNLEQARGIIFIGGRILDPGTLTKNPIRFAVRVRIPNGYPDGIDATDKSNKALLKKIKDDALTLKWIDGNRVKQDLKVTIDAASEELNGPGIASAEVEISSYHGNRFIFTAAPHSAIALRNPEPAPLHQGFTIIWAADPAKDPEGKARLAIDAK
jgi:hypothetical protein